MALSCKKPANSWKNDALIELSKEITDIGDAWRDFAVAIARVYKNRSTQADVYNALSQQLYAIAVREEAFFKKLKLVSKK